MPGMYLAPDILRFHPLSPFKKFERGIFQIMEVINILRRPGKGLTLLRTQRTHRRQSKHHELAKAKR